MYLLFIKKKFGMYDYYYLYDLFLSVSLFHLVGDIFLALHGIFVVHLELK